MPDFHDPDEEIYQQWKKETDKLFPDNINPYSHPDDENMQITPYKGQHRTEYHIALFQDPEPTTPAQKRREELALGIYEKNQ